jgi:halimadienyl-diphosphate synthase
MDSRLTEALLGLLTRAKDAPNHISPSAYDTAWLSWLYPEARDWLLEHQHPDGSWGSEVEFYHDRIISTLSAVNALAATSVGGRELGRVERGIEYLERTLPHVTEDVGDTTAFELLLPSLLQIGQNLGLRLGRLGPLVDNLTPVYLRKLALIPPERLYSPETVLPYSLEFIGFGRLDPAAVPKLRAGNGSIHHSPSATAFAEIAGQGSVEGRAYLAGIIDRYKGAAPGFTPLELFETIWILYHVRLHTDLRSLQSTIGPMVDHMRRAWARRGVGFSVTFPVADPDDTALGFRILADLGVSQDPAVFETYEVGDHFQCYPLESNISLDVHAHIVEALKDAPDFPRRNDLLLKAVTVLARGLAAESIVDRWHISPYYSTAHAILSLAGVSDDAIKRQIQWLLKTQRADGSWTAFPSCPLAAVEETAHALLALMVVYEKGNSVPLDVIERGVRYLERHYRRSEELPALWINKALYNPYHIVESIVLSALAKYERLARRIPRTSRSGKAAIRRGVAEPVLHGGAGG